MIKVNIITSDEVKKMLPFRKKHLEMAVLKFFNLNNRNNVNINIIFIDNETMTGLNENYKGRKGTTDVLSFLLSDDENIIEGEIYISLERAKEQSMELNEDFAHETIRLVFHGLLHLTGWVHDNDEKYQLMMDETDKFVKMFFEEGN